MYCIVIVWLFGLLWLVFCVGVLIIGLPRCLVFLLGIYCYYVVLVGLFVCDLFGVL